MCGATTDESFAAEAAGHAGMLQQSTIRVLLLDVGGVIVPDSDPEQVAALERCLVLPQGSLCSLLYDCEEWKALSTGRLGEELYWQGVAAQAGVDAQSLRVLATPLWGWHRADEAMLALMREIHRRVRLAILTNATLAWEPFLETAGIRDLAHPVINSARIGFRKPDAAAFLHALELLDAPAGSVLFVDDKVRNTSAARRLGIDSIDFTTVEALAEALRARNILVS